MRLYLVQDDTAFGGDNADLFVMASHHQAAVKYWRDHFELDPAVIPERVVTVPSRRKKPGVIEWAAIQQKRFKR